MITGEDLEKIKIKIEEENPHATINWTYSSDKQNTILDDLVIEDYPQSHIQDDKNELIYFIRSITNKSKSYIFANGRIRITIDMNRSFDSIGYPPVLDPPIFFDWIEVKRVKHPDFYIRKTPDQLIKIAFHMSLEKIEYPESLRIMFKSRQDLDYINPKSTHYYLLRCKPEVYHPMAGSIDFGFEGTFI